MSEYIKVSDVLEILNKQAREAFTLSNEYKFYLGALHDVAYGIKELPTEDVVPVKHGMWILDENPHDGDCRCSNCFIAIGQMHERNHGELNALTGGKWWTFYEYCPNCGAKMNGVGKWADI